MPADLQQIVEAARTLVGIEFSHHYLHERQSAEDRPWAADVLYALARGEPRIVRDDHGLEDIRGAVCTIECRTSDDVLLHVVLNYEDWPMRIVTAYEPRRNGDA